MGYLLLVAGVGAAWWMLRTPSHKAEWLLCALVLLGVGYSQIADDRHSARLPDFAQSSPKAGSATSGTVWGGGLSYRELAWLEENQRRFISGYVRNNYTAAWENFSATFEVFDPAGNSLGVLRQEFKQLNPKEEVQFRIEVPFENANRFKLVRFGF